MKAKFAMCAAGRLDEATQRRVVELVEGIDALPSLRPLLACLVPQPQKV